MLPVNLSLIDEKCGAADEQRCWQKAPQHMHDEAPGACGKVCDIDHGACEKKLLGYLMMPAPQVASVWAQGSFKSRKAFREIAQHVLFHGLRRK